MSFVLRTVTSAQFDAFLRVSATAFLDHPSPEGLDVERTLMPIDRTIAGFDGEHIVGTAAAYPFELTVPGGAAVPVAGVTVVTVASTHRRRGLLRQMMEHQLDDVAARGEPIAILNASEGGIYGRFGYGLASLYQSYEIDTRHAAFRDGAVSGPGVPQAKRPVLRLVPQADAVDILPEIYDRCRHDVPGTLSRTDEWWATMLGPKQVWKGGGKLFVLVAEPDTAGDPGGFAIYTVTHGEQGPRLQVRELVAADPGVEAAMWRTLLDTDLVRTLEVESRPLDDVLRWWFADPRQVKVTRVQDYLWVRLLDIPRVLSVRAYASPGDVVLWVDDPFRPSNTGHYRVTADVTGAGTCTRLDLADHVADDAIDIALGVEELGAVYLGGPTLHELARAGRVVERRGGALAVADAMFRGTRYPHCTTKF